MKLKHPAEIVLKALLQGIEVTLGGKKYVLLEAEGAGVHNRELFEENTLLSQDEKWVAAEAGSPGWSGVYNLASFIQTCENEPLENILLIAANSSLRLIQTEK